MTAFDRDALEAVHEAFKRGEQWYRVEAMILALVRPVAGVTIFRDAARSFRLLSRAASAAEERMRGLAAAFAAAGWHGTDSPLNDPRDSIPGRYA